MSNDMNIEEIGQRAAAALLDTAEQEAYSTQALAQILEGAPLVPTRTAPVPSRPRWPWVALATGVAAALVVGLVLVTRPNESTVVDTTVPPTTVATTVAPTTPPPSTEPAVTTVPQTSPPTTVPEESGDPIEVRHGVSIVVPDGARIVQRIETISFGGQERAVSRTRLTLDDGADAGQVRIDLSDSVQQAFGDTEPFSVDGDAGDGFVDVSTGRVVREVEPGVFLTVAAEQAVDVVPTEVLTSIAEQIDYDPTKDRRVRNRTILDSRLDPLCESDEWSFTGATGLPDVVLFTCDGVLARYDGETGERVEVIAEQGSQVPGETLPDEPTFSNAVYDLTVTPDGSTVYYSFGDEPVAGNTVRYRLGSESTDIADEDRGFGSATAVSPDGSLYADSAVTFFTVKSGFNSPDAVASIDFDPGLPTGKPAISPDNTFAAIELGNGVIALVDLTTGDNTLIANDDPDVRYIMPWFDDRGVLQAYATRGTFVLPVSLDGSDVVIPDAADDAQVLPYDPVEGSTLVRNGLLLTDNATEDQVGTGILLAAAIPKEEK